MPDSHILLNGVFPLEKSHKSAKRQKVKTLNTLLATIAENNSKLKLRIKQDNNQINAMRSTANEPV